MAVSTAKVVESNAKPHRNAGAHAYIHLKERAFTAGETTGWRTRSRLVADKRWSMNGAPMRLIRNSHFSWTDDLGADFGSRATLISH